MDMDGSSGMGDMMNSSGSSTMMMSMAAGFTSGPGTTLYSPTWTPTTVGGYAGTCIFLIALSVIFRLGVAVRANLEHHWWTRGQDRRRIIVQGRPDAGTEKRSMRATLVPREGGEPEEVRVMTSAQRIVPPWRLSTDLPRALLVTILAGIAYLL